MAILALDLGTRMGFAYGKDRAPLRSGAVLLKQDGEPADMVFANLIGWLEAEIGKAPRPLIIVKEAALPLQGFKNTRNSQAAVDMAYGMHAIVAGMARRYRRVRCETVHPQTVRKHFIGRGRIGSRAETKAAVIQRCKLLKYLPANSTDDDRADGLAVFDYAAATFARASGGNLFLFGEAT